MLIGLKEIVLLAAIAVGLTGQPPPIPPSPPDPKPAPSPKPPAPRPAPAPVVPAVVTITGPTTVKAFRLVTFTAAGVDPKTQAVWWTVKRVDRDKQKPVDFTGGAEGGVRDATRLQFAAFPGDYDVYLSVITTAGGKSKLTELEWALTVEEPVDVAPPPTPKPPTPKPPGPDPKPEPKPEPKPAPTPADPVLVKAFKAAIAEDLAVRGTAAKAGDVTKLAGVYRGTAVLVGLNDPAVKPKTFSDVLATMVKASRLSGVPPPPDWTSLRAAVDAIAGTFPAVKAIDTEFAAELAARYNRIADALDAAAAP